MCNVAADAVEARGARGASSASPSVGCGGVGHISACRGVPRSCSHTGQLVGICAVSPPRAGEDALSRVRIPLGIAIPRPLQSASKNALEARVPHFVWSCTPRRRARRSNGGGVATPRSRLALINTRPLRSTTSSAAVCRLAAAVACAPCAALASPCSFVVQARGDR